MSHRKNGLRALGLTLVAALGLMAFMAAGAQAHWSVGGKTITGNHEVLPWVHLDFILLVPAQKLEILCETLNGEDVLLLSGTLNALGTLAFSKCISRQNGTPNPKCNPINQPIKAKFTATLILHPNGGRTYVLFAPKTGSTTFTPIKFNEETCALAPENTVKGNLVAECLILSGGVETADDCATERSLHILRQAPAELFEADKLTFGANPATLDGSGNVETLGGASISGLG